MDDVPSFDLKTGQIKTKKAKKEKSPEDMAVQELKQLEKKYLEFNEFGSCVKILRIKNSHTIIYGTYPPKNVKVLYTLYTTSSKTLP